MDRLLIAYMNWRRGAAGAALVVFTLIHPVLHPFEGGSLDCLLAWLAVEACS